MTMCDARGAWQSSRQRATAASMVTESKERPNSSTLSACFIDASSGHGKPVACVPEGGALRVDSGRGGSLAHPQAGVLVGAKEAPELEIVIARQALEPAREGTPKHFPTAE